MTSGLRLQRLLALVSWVAANDGPAISEVCRRFEIGEAQLVAELQMAMMVGGDSIDYGDMPIEVVVEDGRVWVHLLSFRRPLRLTPNEGLTMVAAGAALLDVPGTDDAGPLARALAKLADVLGIDARQAMDVDLGEVAGDAFDTLRTASRDHRRVRIESYTEARDVWTTRIVEPWRVFNEAGRWYVHGFCQQAAGERIFRIDRIRKAATLDETFTPPAIEPVGTSAIDDGELPRVVIELTRDARWVAETYPADVLERHDDGGMVLSLAVTGTPWLERLLVRLGESGRIRDIDERLGTTDLAAQAARRVLGRYRHESRAS